MASFSETLFATICARMAEGEKLRHICKEPDMPNISTVWRWSEMDDERRKQYARAREAQADQHFERIGDVVDKVEDGDLDPQQARTMVDALKWMAARLRPKTYGDKVDVNASGGFTIVLGDHVGKV